MSAELQAIITRSSAGLATLSDAFYLLEMMQVESDRLTDLIENLPEIDIST